MGGHNVIQCTKVIHMDCAHYWRVEAPDGDPQVAARCRLCGAERQFGTSWPEDKSRFSLQRASGRKGNLISE